MQLCHISAQTKTTQLKSTVRQGKLNIFTGMKTGQSGLGGDRGKGLLLFYYFYLSASKCLTQSSQQALQPVIVDHFILIPWAHSNTEHILNEKDSSDSPIRIPHCHKQIFGTLTAQFIDSPQVLTNEI